MSSAPSLILPPDGARPATYDHRQSAIALSNTATEAVRLALSNSEISSKDADEDERRDSFNDGSSDIDCVSTSDATAIGADTQASSDRSPHFYMHQGKDNERIDPLAIQSRGKGSVFGSFVATQGEPRRRASLMYMPDNALRNLQVETIIKQRRMEISLTKLVQFDPQRRKAKDNLARYFQRWAMALPLYQKCDELGLQLRERNRALQSIREAYVKDVLSVKMKLEEVLKELGAKDDSAAQLEALPSVDLRGMLSEFLVKDISETVKRNPNDLVTSEAFPRPGSSQSFRGMDGNIRTSDSFDYSSSARIPGVNTHMALDKTLVSRSASGFMDTDSDSYGDNSTTDRAIAIRGGLRRAPQASASSQLQHMFAHKLTKQYTEAQKLPWEQSCNYELYKSYEQGFEYKIPKNGKIGVAIDVHAPKNFKLLVRYCSECIGFMGLVHEWNDVVEMSLQRSIEKRNETLFRDAIMRLNETIYNQSHEILNLQTKLKSIERSTKWLSDKAEQEDQKNTIFKLSEKLNILQNFAGMCQEDRDGIQLMLQDRYLGTIEAKELRVLELGEEINSKNKTIQALHNKIADHGLHIASYDARIAKMLEERDGLVKSIGDLTEKLEEKSALAAELLRGLNSKDDYILSFKKSNSSKVAEAKQKYDKLNEEYMSLESDWKELNSRYDSLLDESARRYRTADSQIAKMKEQHGVALSYQLSRVSMIYEDELSRLRFNQADRINEMFNRPIAPVVPEPPEPMTARIEDTAAATVRKKIVMIRKKSSRKSVGVASSSGARPQSLRKSASVPFESTHRTYSDDLENLSFVDNSSQNADGEFLSARDNDLDAQSFTSLQRSDANGSTVPSSIQSSARPSIVSVTSSALLLPSYEQDQVRDPVQQPRDVTRVQKSMSIEEGNGAAIASDAMDSSPAREKKLLSAPTNEEVLVSIQAQEEIQVSTSISAQPSEVASMDVDAKAVAVIVESRADSVTENGIAASGITNADDMIPEPQKSSDKPTIEEQLQLEPAIIPHNDPLSENTAESPNGDVPIEKIAENSPLPQPTKDMNSASSDNLEPSPVATSKETVSAKSVDVLPNTNAASAIDTFILPPGLKPEDYTTGPNKALPSASVPGRRSALADGDMDEIKTETSSGGGKVSKGVKPFRNAPLDETISTIEPTTRANTEAMPGDSQYTDKKRPLISELPLKKTYRVDPEPYVPRDRSRTMDSFYSEGASFSYLGSEDQRDELDYDDAERAIDQGDGMDIHDDMDAIHPEALKRLETMQGDVDIAAWDFMSISKLRVAIWRVRFLIRLKKGLSEKRFDLLGAYGFRLKSLCLDRELSKVRIKSREMAEKVDALEKVVVDKEARAALAAKEHKERIDALNSSVAALTKAHEDMQQRVDAVKSMSRRERVLSMAQRAFSKSLAEALAILRARIYVLLHIDDLKNSIPHNMIDPPKKKERVSNALVVQPRGKRVVSSFGTKAYAKEMEALREHYKQMKETNEASADDDGSDNSSKETPLYVTRKWFFHLVARLRKTRLERPFVRSSGGIGGSSSPSALRFYLSTEDALVNSLIRGVTSDMDKLEQFVYLLREDQRSKSNQISVFKQFLGISETGIDANLKDSNSFCDLDVESIRLLATVRNPPLMSALQRFQTTINDPEFANMDIITLSTCAAIKGVSSVASGFDRRRGAVSMPAGFVPQPMVKAYENAHIASERNLNRRIDAEKQRVCELEDEVAGYMQVKSRLEADLDIMVDDYEFLSRQNKTLKTALEDSYRAHQKMNADELRQRGLDIAYKQSIMRSKSTQVACVPCDLEQAIVSDTGVHIHKGQRPVAARRSEIDNSVMAVHHDILPNDAAEPFDSRGKTVVLNRVPLTNIPASVPVGAAMPVDSVPLKVGVLKEFLEGDRNAATEFKKLFVSTRQRPQSARQFEKRGIIEDAFSRSKRVNDVAVASAAPFRLPDLDRERQHSNDRSTFMSQSASHPALGSEVRAVRARPQTAFAKIKSIPQKVSDVVTQGHTDGDQATMEAQVVSPTPTLPPSISALAPSTVRRFGAADAQMASSLQVLHEARANDLAVAETYERLREYERLRLLDSLQAERVGGAIHLAESAVSLGNKAPRPPGNAMAYVGPSAYSSSAGAVGLMDDASNLLIQGAPHHPEQIKQMQSLKTS